jgi:hypothetical protein
VGLVEREHPLRREAPEFPGPSLFKRDRWFVERYAYTGTLNVLSVMVFVPLK